MNIGELFINLGIKGSEKTIGAVSNLKKSLNETKDTSLAAKSAIVGAMYALERLFQTSGTVGTGLTNFNSLLGVSTKTLQEYQYAARQMGVANEDVAGTFKNLQAAMTKALIGQGKPAGLGRLGMLTGAISQADIAKFQQHPEQLLQRLQEYALKEGNVGLRNETLKSFNLSDPMVAALARNAFQPSALKKAPTYGEKELAALDRANIAWSNLGTKIEMAIGHFNARHGSQLVNDISQMVGAVVKLANAFEKLAQSVKLFSIVGKTLEGLSGVIGNTAILLGGSDKERQAKADSIIESLRKKSIAPAISPAAGAGRSPQSVEVNQTLQFQHDGTDHKKTSDSVKQAVKQSYRQMSAQLQGS